MTRTEAIAALDRIDQEAVALAARIKEWIPADPKRDDPTWEAHTFCGGVGANAKRAADALRRVVRQTMGEVEEEAEDE